jgi:hypothetical protein
VTVLLSAQPASTPHAETTANARQIRRRHNANSTAPRACRNPRTVGALQRKRLAGTRTACPQRDWRRPARARLPSTGRRVTRVAPHLPDGTWQVNGLNLSRSGVWTVRVIVPTEGGAAIVLDAPIEIGK